jgi:hypothetical protein
MLTDALTKLVLAKRLPLESYRYPSSVASFIFKSWRNMEIPYIQLQDQEIDNPSRWRSPHLTTEHVGVSQKGQGMVIQKSA